MKDARKYVLTYGEQYDQMLLYDEMVRFFKNSRRDRSNIVYMLFVGFIRYFGLVGKKPEEITATIYACYGGYISGPSSSTIPVTKMVNQEKVVAVPEKKVNVLTNEESNENNIFGAGGVFDIQGFQVK